MAFRNLTKVPKLCLVYFAVDKSTCVIETKKLRSKETGQLFSETGPKSREVVTLKNGGKLFDAMVIAADDVEDNLNAEEKAFVEDPVNAELFNESPLVEKKRPREDQPIVTGVAKRKKTADNEVQMLNAFLKEKDEKEARLKQQRIGKKVQTSEVAVQTAESIQTEVAVQTDFTADVMEDLKEQVRHLTKIVAELSALKARDERKGPSRPLFDDDDILSDTLSDVLPFGNGSIEDVPETPPEVPSAVNPVSAIHSQAIAPPPPPPPPAILQLRSPLSTISQNTQVVHRSDCSYGPTDEQRRKVEALVSMGSNIITTAMASVNVLFTDAELANGNTSGSSGFQQLDELKLRFLESKLRQKFDSSVFHSQWDNIRARINTKCRGKRRTIIRRLEKQTQF